jgi:hypothetical protein
MLRKLYKHNCREQAITRFERQSAILSEIEMLRQLRQSPTWGDLNISDAVTKPKRRVAADRAPLLPIPLHQEGASRIACVSLVAPVAHCLELRVAGHREPVNCRVWTGFIYVLFCPPHPNRSFNGESLDNQCSATTADFPHEACPVHRSSCSCHRVSESSLTTRQDRCCNHRVRN